MWNCNFSCMENSISAVSEITIDGEALKFDVADLPLPRRTMTVNLRLSSFFGQLGSSLHAGTLWRSYFNAVISCWEFLYIKDRFFTKMWLTSCIPFVLKDHSKNSTTSINASWALPEAWANEYCLKKAGGQESKEEKVSRGTSARKVVHSERCNSLCVERRCFSMVILPIRPSCNSASSANIRRLFLPACISQ